MQHLTVEMLAWSPGTIISPINIYSQMKALGRIQASMQTITRDLTSVSIIVRISDHRAQPSHLCISTELWNDPPNVAPRSRMGGGERKERLERHITQMKILAFLEMVDWSQANTRARHKMNWNCRIGRWQSSGDNYSNSVNKYRSLGATSNTKAMILSCSFYYGHAASVQIAT